MRKVVLMDYADYKSEHRRLTKVLKGAHTKSAKAELRKQLAEKPKVITVR